MLQNSLRDTPAYKAYFVCLFQYTYKHSLSIEIVNEWGVKHSRLLVMKSLCIVCYSQSIFKTM